MLFGLLEFEDLLLLLLLLEIDDHGSSVRLLVNLLALLVVAPRLLHHALEGVYPFAHARVQSRFYKVEVVVQELSEAHEESNRLLKVAFHVNIEKCELDHSVCELLSLKRRELLGKLRRNGLFVVEHSWRLLYVAP